MERKAEVQIIGSFPLFAVRSLHAVYNTNRHEYWKQV